ncbi:hypothetical protein C8F01DRAFT_1121666 [Mycena amicta]|nr:hypothetical protein C8F01DRAFT_1121666 [Mycena amicta]
MLAAQTVMEHGTAQESAEAQSYLVENFSADALPLDQEESTTDDLADSARRLERLQRDNSRLTGSNFSRSHSGNAKTANTPRRRIQRVETAGMTPSAAMGAASGNQQHPPRSRIQRVGVAPAATPMDIDSDPPATSSKRRLTASEDASGVVERSRKRLRKGGA